MLFGALRSWPPGRRRGWAGCGWSSARVGLAAGSAPGQADAHSGRRQP